MIIKCVVACHDANGAPDLVPVLVEATVTQRDNGDHYEMASERVRSAGYGMTRQVFDEQDPGWYTLDDDGINWGDAFVAGESASTRSLINNQTVLICQRGAVLVVLDLCGWIATNDQILDWYAEQYAIERAGLSLGRASTIYHSGCMMTLAKQALLTILSQYENDSRLTAFTESIRATLGHMNGAELHLAQETYKEMQSVTSSPST